MCIRDSTGTRCIGINEFFQGFYTTELKPDEILTEIQPVSYTHLHPGPSATSGVSSGSFQIPNSGETAVNVFYRLYLVVTDLQGGKDTSFVDILPNTATITLNTNPQGLQITLDGQPFTAPYSSSSVVGMLRAIGTPSPQGQYSFSSWSHGGSANQSITTPVSNTSYLSLIHILLP